MYPVLVVLVYATFFERKISLIKVICTVLSAAGVMFFYSNNRANIVGILLAFTSAVSYAFYATYLDRSGLKSLSPFKLTFYLSIVSSVELFLFSLATKTFTLNIDPVGWLLTVLFVIFIAIGATISFQAGIIMIGPQRAAILGTIEPITSIIVGIIAFDEVFNIKVGMGIFFIILSVVLLITFDK